MAGWSVSTLLHVNSVVDTSPGDLAVAVSSPVVEDQPQPAFVSDLLKRMNHKTSVRDIRLGAGINDLLDPDFEAILYGYNRTHPTQRLVIDVGPFNGMDIAYPAYKRGYTVVSFELSRTQQTKCVQNWKAAGLEEGKDFEVIDGPFPLEKPLIGYIGASDTPRIYLVKAGASDTTAQVGVSGASETAEVRHGASRSSSTAWVTRVDECVSPNANIFLLKTDAEGHDGKALKGAAKLLANTYTTMLEFRPSSMRAHGTDPVELLQWLWDEDFQCYDMNTHPGYEPTAPFKGGLARPSAIADFVAYLEHIPKGKGPAGDALGGWEDLICAKRRQP